MGIEYQISEGWIARHRIRMGVKELLCSRCGKRILPGDWVHRNGYLPRLYHLSCFEEMFLDV